MNTISINVNGTDLETINITLNSDEVKALYESNKELKTQFLQMTKDFDYEKRMKEHYSKESDKFREELNGMHALFTAFEVPEKYKNEGMYSEVTYPLATRMALYLSKKD